MTKWPSDQFMNPKQKMESSESDTIINVHQLHNAHDNIKNIKVD
jgi:hypothetical protein